MDVRDHVAVEEAINGIVRDFGGLDVLLCSAGNDIFANNTYNFHDCLGTYPRAKVSSLTTLPAPRYSLLHTWRLTHSYSPLGVADNLPAETYPADREFHFPAHQNTMANEDS